LKAPGFNPWTYKVVRLGFKVCFQIQLVPLHQGAWEKGLETYAKNAKMRSSAKSSKK
jgi:hypothetical protein